MKTELKASPAQRRGFDAFTAKLERAAETLRDPAQRAAVLAQVETMRAGRFVGGAR